MLLPPLPSFGRFPLAAREGSMAILPLHSAALTMFLIFFCVRGSQMFGGVTGAGSCEPAPFPVCAG